MEVAKSVCLGRAEEHLRSALLCAGNISASSGSATKPGRRAIATLEHAFDKAHGIDAPPAPRPEQFAFHLDQGKAPPSSSWPVPFPEVGYEPSLWPDWTHSTAKQKIGPRTAEQCDRAITLAVKQHSSASPKHDCSHGRRGYPLDECIFIDGVTEAAVRKVGKKSGDWLDFLTFAAIAVTEEAGKKKVCGKLDEEWALPMVKCKPTDKDRSVIRAMVQSVLQSVKTTLSENKQGHVEQCPAGHSPHGTCLDGSGQHDPQQANAGHATTGQPAAQGMGQHTPPQGNAGHATSGQPKAQGMGGGKLPVDDDAHWPTGTHGLPPSDDPSLFYGTEGYGPAGTTSYRYQDHIRDLKAQARKAITR